MIRYHAVVVGLALLLTAGATVNGTSAEFADPTAAQRFDWPATGTVTREYEAPARAYARGHRGIDIFADADEVRAPADGVVAFVGDVVDRPVITIDHGSGVVSTLEPVTALVAVGDIIRGGDVVGKLAEGGHSRAGDLHFGVRVDGAYINPRLLIGGIPRAVLLPCCEAVPATG